MSLTKIRAAFRFIGAPRNVVTKRGDGSDVLVFKGVADWSVDF